MIGMSTLELAIGGLPRGAFGEYTEAILDHDLIPFKGAAYYMKYINTAARAAQYAAGGFHTSVTRGLAGGSSDPASAITGSAAGETVKVELNDGDITEAWMDAARAYKDAYDEAVGGKASVPGLVAMLLDANSLADKAYGMEHVAPPRAPTEHSRGGGTEVAAAAPSEFIDKPVGMSMATKAGIGIVGGILMIAVAAKIRDADRKAAAGSSYGGLDGIDVTTIAIPALLIGAGYAIYRATRKPAAAATETAATPATQRVAPDNVPREQLIRLSEVTW